MVVRQRVLTLHLMRYLPSTNFESTVQNNFEEITMTIYLNQSRALLGNFLVSNRTAIVFIVIMSYKKTQKQNHHPS